MERINDNNTLILVVASADFVAKMLLVLQVQKLHTNS